MNFKVKDNFLSILAMTLLLGGFALQAMIPEEEREKPPKTGLLTKLGMSKKKRIEARLVDSKGNPTTEFAEVVTNNIDEQGNQIVRRTYRYKTKNKKQPKIYLIYQDGLIENGQFYPSETMVSIPGKGSLPVKDDEIAQVGQPTIAMESLYGYKKSGESEAKKELEASHAEYLKSLSSYYGTGSASKYATVSGTNLPKIGEETQPSASTLKVKKKKKYRLGFPSFSEYRTSKTKTELPEYEESQESQPEYPSSTFSQSQTAFPPSRITAQSSFGEGSSSYDVNRNTPPEGTGNIGPANVNVKEDMD